MTDALTHKTNMGQLIVQGFEADIHCANGAPKESYVKITKAESGEPDGKTWRTAELGFRPLTANEAVKKYLNGEFVD